MSPLLLRLLLALTLIVAACSPQQVTAARTSPAPRLAALRAGTSGDYPPLSSWNVDHPEGFAPSLLGAFAASQRRELAWTRFQWPTLVADLRADRFDLAADGITVRPERSVAGRFTVPIATGGAVLLLSRPPWATRAGGGESALAMLRALDRPELRVVVNRGGHLERVARRLLPSATIRAIPDNAAVRDALARHEADAAMTNTFEAPRWSEGLAGIEALGPLTNDVTALWVRADQPELGEQLDTWLLDEEESGRLAALRARTLGPGGGGATARPVSALLAATVERLALMPFVAAAKQRTGKAVEDAAQEQRVIAAGADAVTKAALAHGTAPPRRELVDAFFRVQIEAAKAVQARATPDASAPSFSLEDELRPAIARITGRMAFLVVRIPRGTTRAAALGQAHADLDDTGPTPAQIDQLAAAIAAFGGE